jgi:hypothetical protein
VRNTSEYEFEGLDYRFTEEESGVTFGGELGLRYPIMQQLDVGTAAAFYDTKRYDE